MSYGTYVQACIDARRRAALGGLSWLHGAQRFAAQFPDEHEERVVAILRELRWPDRPVSYGEVDKRLRAGR